MAIYKCLPTEFGVDVSFNRTSFFSFSNLTHSIIDLGDGNVRINRKIEDFVEILSTPVNSFVDLNLVPVATTYGDLVAYFNVKRGAVKAGEGVNVLDNTVSLVAGGPSTLGGYRVGTGLTVDGLGRLSANAVSEVTRILSTEAEMLAVASESERPYRIIRLDTKRLYYLNAGDSPSVLSNWFVGPSIETAVMSYNGRTGGVVSEFGDYNFDLIPLTDKTTNASHKFVIDNGEIFIENIATSVRVKLSSSDSVDLGPVEIRVTTLEDLINSPSTGINKKVSDLTSEVTRVTNSVFNATTGLEGKVITLESTVSNKANLVDGKVPVSELPPLGTTDSEKARITALEANRTSDKALIDANTTKNNSQDTRITTLEEGKIGVIQKGTANGVASLDSSAKVPINQLPSFLPQTKRVWRDAKPIRTVGTWITNTSNNEMIVHVRASLSTSANRFVSLLVRESAAFNPFTFNSNVMNPLSAGNGYADGNTITVPAGWQYQLSTTGGSTDALTERWYEMY